MSFSPRVSIIIAALNCEKYVEESIYSIVNQSFTDWEILVADDGSTDRTKVLIDTFLDPRIRRFHNTEHLGLVQTWNKLIRHARGELLAWQDADDVSEATRLEKMVKTFDEHPEIMFCGCNFVRYYQFSNRKIVSSYPLSHEEICRYIEMKRRVPFTGATRVVRREVFDEVEGFRDFFTGLGAEDHDFILRVVEKFQVANIPDVLYVNRYTRGSSSRKTATESTYLRLYSSRIAFFLADQRKRNHGLDGLMDGGDKQEFEQFLQQLRQEFQKDRSIIYRRAARTKINNQDYIFAFLDAFRAVQSNPLKFDNYLLFPQTLGSLIKVLFRVAKQRNRPKCSIISSEH